MVLPPAPPHHPLLFPSCLCAKAQGLIQSLGAWCRYDDRRYDDRRPDDRRDDRRGRDYDRRPQYERVGKRPLDTEGSSSLFVGNLPYDIRDDEFEDIFAKYGKLVSTKLGMNRETRMCR